MDYFSVVLFLFLYYIRPQEWVLLLLDLPLVQYVMILALTSLLFKKPALSFRDLFRSPHDLFILFFFLWVVFSAPAGTTAFGDMRNLSLFYVIIVQALGNRARLRQFVTVWTWMVVAIAALALASEFGFDPMGSYDLTHSMWMKGRLCLNTSIFNNPNSLAHAVVPSIVMIYYLFIWRRPIFIKETLGFLLALPIWCIYLTESRGGYMAGVSSFGIAMLFGRNKLLQLFMVVLILVVVPPLLSSIRGMQRTDDKGTEASVQGRQMAFQFGIATYKNNMFRGLGYRQFTLYSPWKTEIIKGVKINTTRIAPHSAINGIGAEQGRVGLFLWLGTFYCCIRTLVMSVCKNEDDERLRRLLLSITVCFLVSAWFIDIEYHGTFFILNATVAAFHRLVRLGLDSGIPKPAPNLTPSITVSPIPLAESGAPPLIEPPTPKPKIWNRFTALDLLLLLAFNYVVFKIWEHLSRTM